MGAAPLQSLQEFQLCSTESMDLLTFMMLIILKGSLCINSCYILVYFRTDKNLKKSLFLHPLCWMCRSFLHCRYYIWFAANGCYVNIWASLITCLWLQPIKVYKYFFSSLNVTISNIWKYACYNIKMWGIFWLITG
jgi:hypothetical protein